MPDEDIERLLRLFPNLRERYICLASEPAYYNCFAWAVHDDGRWWGLDRSNGDYWPPDAPRRNTVEALVAAFATFGFETCSSGDHESGVEKIAIYVGDSGEPEHAARQLPSGVWASKVGLLQDIEHLTLKDLEGNIYGTAQTFLARPISTKQEEDEITRTRNG